MKMNKKINFKKNITSFLLSLFLNMIIIKIYPVIKVNHEFSRPIKYYKICSFCKLSIETCPNDEDKTFYGRHPFSEYRISENKFCDLCDYCSKTIACCEKCRIFTKPYYLSLCPLCKWLFTSEEDLFEHIIKSCAKTEDIIGYNGNIYIKLPKDLKNYKPKSDVFAQIKQLLEKMRKT